MPRFGRVSLKVSDYPSELPNTNPFADTYLETYSEPAIPTTSQGNESPHSSAPSTPEDQARSGKRADAVKIAGVDDYLSDGRLVSESKSAPVSPNAMMSKSLIFSPQLQFHDTWPSGEYDRRGDIATCNRLTPLLAQQIKEELNNFKMVRHHFPFLLR